jgi:hypothetical protein
VFLVAAIDHATGTVLGQRQVADKRGENTAVEPLLSGLAAGRVWTLDALHTSKKTARLITGSLQGHYILILKGTQPLALQAAQALLSGTDTQFAEHTDRDTDRGHGRTEHRTLRVAGCDDRLFPGARQVFRLRRDTGGLEGVREQTNRLRHRQHERRPGRPRSSQPLHPTALVRGGPFTLGEGCNVP